MLLYHTSQSNHYTIVYMWYYTVVIEILLYNVMQVKLIVCLIVTQQDACNIDAAPGNRIGKCYYIILASWIYHHTIVYMWYYTAVIKILLYIAFSSINKHYDMYNIIP